MAQLYQITEDDLSELERTLPQLADAVMPHLTPRLKTQIRRLRAIMSDVRWNYGPPAHVETLADDSDEGIEAA